MIIMNNKVRNASKSGSNLPFLWVVKLFLLRRFEELFQADQSITIEIYLQEATREEKLFKNEQK